MAEGAGNKNEKQKKERENETRTIGEARRKLGTAG
jgi:hypothetical protein